MSSPHSATAAGARAIRFVAERRAVSPQDLTPEEQLLLLESMFRLEPLARTANEHEFTLKKMLTVLTELLEVDLAAFVDFRQETVYGLAERGSAKDLARQLDLEANALFLARAEFGRHRRNTVLWNRRLMQAIPIPEGDWIAVPSSNIELVDGCYLFHAPGGWRRSPAALTTICASAEQCLLMPELILKNEQLHADMVKRYGAVSEMTSLFRNIDDPDFPNQFLLILMDYARVDRGLFWEFDPSGGLRRVVQYGISDALAENFSLDGGTLFWQQMLAQPRVVWLEEPLLLAGLPKPGQVSIDTLQTQVCHSFLGFPLNGSEGLVGVVGLLDADFTRAGGEYFISVISEIGASYLDNSQRHRALLEAKEIEDQVRIAGEIQQGLLPKDLPDVPGFELIASNSAAQELGGDFYYMSMCDGHLHAAIGDVSGKGIPAGLLMSGSRFLLRAGDRLKLPNEQIIGCLNNVLTDETPADRFVTMYYVDLDPVTGLLECWNAGHDPLMLWRRRTQEIVQVQADGMILGVLDEQHYHHEYVQLEPGDVVLLFTDGLPEGMNARREQFGFSRIEQILRAYGDQPAQVLWSALLQAHTDFTAGQPPHDDLTLILIRALPDATFTPAGQETSA